MGNTVNKINTVTKTVKNKFTRSKDLESLYYLCCKKNLKLNELEKYEDNLNLINTNYQGSIIFHRYLISSDLNLEVL